MKWYAYNDDGTNYTMILDHNTTATVAWNSSGSNSEGMKEVAEVLNTDTGGWNSSLNSRLITVSEINVITGKTKFDSTNSSSWYFFENKEQSISTYPTIAKYGWLFDRTSSNCTRCGCLNNATGTHSGLGYWTSSPIGDSSAGSVLEYGDLVGGVVNITTNRGVRQL